MNIVLIGFMGSGKTTVGKKLAAGMGYTFLDTDQYIEERAGMKISEIFSRKGEAAFRELESLALKEIAGMDGCVVSTGGGLPMREENRKLLKQIGMVIYLDAVEETLWKRLADDRARPLLRGEDPRGKIHTLLSERAPVYGHMADHVIPVDGRQAGDIAAEIEIIVKSA